MGGQSRCSVRADEKKNLIITVKAAKTSTAGFVNVLRPEL